MQIEEVYQEKTNTLTCEVGKKLIEIMLRKQSNLCVSADVTTTSALVKLIDAVGPSICVLKTHIDIVNDFTPDFIQVLKQKAAQYDFLIFEDRKFADIGNTVLHQYTGGLYQVATWADLVTAHMISGPGIIETLRSAYTDAPRAVMLIAQMSSAGNLCDPRYAQQCVVMAREHKDFVLGFIGQSRLCEDKNFMLMTPGISLEATTDNNDQCYRTPEAAIADAGSDVLIVGRAITGAKDPRETATHYQKMAWHARMKSVS